MYFKFISAHLSGTVQLVDMDMAQRHIVDRICQRTGHILERAQPRKELSGRKNILGRLLARTYILKKTYPGLDILEWTSPRNDISRKDI
jgi:hypothetical protein